MSTITIMQAIEAKGEIVKTTTKTEAVEKVDLQREAVFLGVKFGKLYVRRQVSNSVVQVDEDTDKDLIHVSKEILEAEELKKIESCDNEIRTYVVNQCLPSPLGKGFYLLPLRLLKETMEKLEEFRGQREFLIERFLQVYEAKVENAKGRLGTLYKSRDYPPVEAVADKFYFTTVIMDLSTPDTLKAISSTLYAAELRKARETWDQAKEAISAVLYQEMRELVNNLAEKLKPGQDGKRKVFRDSLIENFRRWADVFDARNLTKDRDLAEMVEAARGMIEGRTAEDVRSSDSLREGLSRDFAQLSETLDSAMVNKPGRAIDFEA